MVSTVRVAPLTELSVPRGPAYAPVPPMTARRSVFPPLRRPATTMSPSFSS
jgi:hypothetical protein